MNVLRRLGACAFLAIATAAVPSASWGQAPVTGYGRYNSSTPSLTNKQLGELQLDAAGNLKTVGSGTPTGTQDVNISQVAGAAVATGHGTAAGALRVELPTDGTGVVGLNAGSASIGTVQPGNTANTTPWLMTPAAGTGNGASVYFLQPAASDNHANIKNGAGTAYFVTAFNNSATINYLRLYDLGTGFNGCNSATGLLTQMQIPASTSVGGFTIPLGPVGVQFSTGLSICVTSGYATTDTTNATASAMSITVGYK